MVTALIMVAFRAGGMMRLYGFLLSGLLFVCSGCVNTDVIVQKQGEMDRRLEGLAQAGALQTQRINDLSSEVAQLKQFRLQDQQEIETLRGAVKELRVREASSVTGAHSEGGRLEVINRDGVDTESGPPTEYLKAFGLFSANDYGAAIAAFEAFIRSNPNSEYAANARYWIGECHFARKEFELARIAYQVVIDGYSHSSKVPDSMLGVSNALMQLGRQAQGRVVMEELVRRFPDTQAAGSAKRQLILMDGGKKQP